MSRLGLTGEWGQACDSAILCHSPLLYCLTPDSMFYAGQTHKENSPGSEAFSRAKEPKSFRMGLILAVLNSRCEDVRLFSQKETELFESVFHEKLQPVRDRHFAEVNRIQWSNVQHKLNLLISEHLKFKKGYGDARVQAYAETCHQIGKYPDRLDSQEFASELTALVTGGTDDISRAYKDPLGPIRAQSLERTMELLQIQLGQIIGPAMSPVQRLVAEGNLNRESSNREDQIQEVSKHVAAFYEHIGHSCHTLGDLDWAETNSYLDRIPTDIERVDFLRALAKLRNDGVENNSIVDPAKHNRNRDTLLRPLNDECSRLLARHFNLENIVKEAEEISGNVEAIDYLWRALRSFKKYHPGTQQERYLPHEFRFCKGIEAEIQYRKDIQAVAAVPGSINNTITVGENRGNIQQGGSANSQDISGQDNEVK